VQTAPLEARPRSSSPPAPRAPRDPTATTLHRVLREHLATFLARAEDGADARGLPRFVRDELTAYLQCGVLAHGFARLQCDACKADRLVPFSCGGRGFCPSCGGRRMNDTAAVLVDHVLPSVPFRQWTLSLPFRLRYLLAFDARLKRDVLAIYVRTIFGFLRKSARRLGVHGARAGSVTYAQRFGGSINLNLHFHTLAFDGVYTRPGDDAPPVFHALPPPTDDDVATIAATVARRVGRLLRRRGLARDTGGDGDGDGDDGAGEPVHDPLAEESPLLAACYGASIRGTRAFARYPGFPVRRSRDAAPLDPALSIVRPLCARSDGFDLHADVAVPAWERKGLEHLCRYIARPAIATERLSLTPDGKVAYDLRHPWRDGTTALLFEPMELIGRLAALVPYPRAHLIHFHGPLANHAAWRPEIVPRSLAETDEPDRPDDLDRPLTASGPAHQDAGVAPPDLPQLRRKGRLPWAALLYRTLGIDALACDNCGSRLRFLAFLTDPPVVRAILDSLGLPSSAPPLAGARHPP